jgi:hypothetical protein
LHDIPCLFQIQLILARQVRDLLSGWAAEGWLEISNPARKSRRYRLSAK